MHKNSGKWLLAVFWCFCELVNGSGRNISIVGDEFMLDGKPLQIVSGSVHYFRMPAEYWRDRLQKLRAVGFNAVATYVEWSFHEPEERHYRLTGDYDIAKFVEIASEEGLLVLLRPGPYICAERDLGGLPYWLLSKYPQIKLRSADPDFILETRIWMTILFQDISPLLYGNGGPIILVQVENEYGSYGDSMPYKVAVRDIVKEHVGNNALLYTTDGNSSKMIRGGAVPGALTTIDFGVDSNLGTVFTPLRNFMPSGPLMNSEFYPGWLTHWGETLQRVEKDKVVRSLRDMLDNKINVNMYVFFGGTNFEFSAGGSNFFSNTYMPDITSYDYDAPLSEAGDPTPKYFAIRELMEKYDPKLKQIPLPTPADKGAYGKVTVEQQLNLLSAEGRSQLGRPYKDIAGAALPTFESLRQRAGLMLYETSLVEGDGVLKIMRPRDRVYVYVDGELKGVIHRMIQQHSLAIQSKPNSVLSLLVENQGRINSGSRIHDFKGILGDVTYQNKVLDGKWHVTGYPLEKVDEVTTVPNTDTVEHGPVVYKGQFTLHEGEKPLDTFLNTTSWHKGYVWVNGHNLGRYWQIGPQVTLYVPGVWLRAAPAHHIIVVLELGRPAPDLSLTFIDYPILNRTLSSTMTDPQVLLVLLALLVDDV